MNPRKRLSKLIGASAYHQHLEPYFSFGRSLNVNAGVVTNYIWNHRYGWSFYDDGIPNPGEENNWIHILGDGVDNLVTGWIWTTTAHRKKGWAYFDPASFPVNSGWRYIWAEAEPLNEMHPVLANPAWIESNGSWLLYYHQSSDQYYSWHSNQPWYEL